MHANPAPGFLSFGSLAAPKLALLTAIIFTAFYGLAPIHFVANDDMVMMLLASGRYSGEHSPNLVFINYHLGQVMAALYSAAPGLEWYVLFQLLILATATAVPLALLLDRVHRGAPLGVVFFALLLAAILSSVIALQFTKTAAIAMAIGVWSMLVPTHRVFPIVGCVLILSAVLLRLEAALLALIVIAPFVVLAVMSRVARPPRAFLLCATVAVSLAVHVSGEWRFSALHPEYTAYNDLRGQINDNPNSELTADDLPAGISLNDYELLVSFFPDAAQFDSAILQEIDAAIDSRVQTISPETWLWTAHHVIDTSDTNLLVALLILLAFGSRSWPVALVTLASAVVYFLPLLYVEMTAILKYRVLFSAQIPIIASLFFLNVWKPNTALRVTCALVAAAMILDYAKNTRDSMEHFAEEREVFQAQSALIQSWPGDVYVFGGAYRIQGARMLSDDLDLADKPVTFLGWMVKHPDNGKYVDYLDFLRDDAVIYFGRKDGYGYLMELLQLAYYENYGKAVRYRVVAADAGGVLIKINAL